MCLQLRKEFRLQNFGLNGTERKYFYKSQWGLSDTLFIIFRLFLVLYMLGWLIWQVVDATASSFVKDYQFIYYLTNWVEVLTILYLLVSLSVTIHEVLQDRLEKTTRQKRNRELQWFHRLTWVLFNCSFSFSILVDVIFWSLLAGLLPPEYAFHPLSVHLHLVNILFLTADLCVGSLQIRLLHFIHGVIFGFIYAFFSLMLHVAGVISAIYPILDWRNPGMTVGVIVILGVIVLPLLQLFSLLICYARKSLARKCFHELVINEPIECSEIADMETNNISSL